MWTEIADNTDRLPPITPWVMMWLLAFAIYFTCKLIMWWPVQARQSTGRHIGFFLAWPGMDADAFLSNGEPAQPVKRDWLAAVGKALLGVALVWLVARVASPAQPTLAAWLAMIGLVLLLHFGLMQLATLAWQASGVDAKPLMRRPLYSRSLADLWGRRWNTGFNALARRFVFGPLAPRVGVFAATGIVFLLSGLVHDLVISLPARGGYGRPTLYFLIQFAGLLLERTPLLRKLTGRRIIGWLYTLIVAIAPLPLLFHRPFIERVIIPFLHAIGALP